MTHAKRSLTLASLLACACLAAACGDSDTEPMQDASMSPPTSTDVDASTSAPAEDAATGNVPFAFTDALTMGDTIPSTYKCESPLIGGGMGDNLSPPLAWEGAPEGTMSFALVLFDTRYSIFHWALWDIPASVTELPEGIAPGYDVTDPAGAHQGAAFMGDPHTYFGPCSSASPLAGVYEFRLYALSVDALDLTADATSTEIQAAIDAATLEQISWEGTPE